jgi:hypothetical protein
VLVQSLKRAYEFLTRVLEAPADVICSNNSNELVWGSAIRKKLLGRDVKVKSFTWPEFAPAIEFSRQVVARED